jgi:hypothetical protein
MAFQVAIVVSLITGLRESARLGYFKTGLGYVKLGFFVVYERFSKQGKLL